MQSHPKLLITIRHGERTDLAGLTPSFGQFDPEMTPKGLKQTYDAGVLLSNKLKELGYNSHTTKINIISSPFLRTIQTSREFINGINSCKEFTVPNTINLHCSLGEIIEGDWFKQNYPKDFLNIIKPNKNFEDEVKGVELKLMTAYDLLPTQDENEKVLLKRIAPYINKQINDAFESEYDVTVLVTHGAPITEINRCLNGPEPYDYFNIKYCEMFLYEIKGNKAEFKIKISS